MSLNYAPVLWNRQKKIYDRVILGLMTLFLLVFIVLHIAFLPEVTVETLVIRSTGSLAFLMLHVILCIGPLARLDARFLPLLYNRRHLGVSMSLVAVVHGMFNIVQFHALGNVDPLISVFASNLHYDSAARFPFQALGFLALLILALMASTSHDFWLKNLSPKVWKSLHMMVYAAYALLVMHVMLGVIQLEKSPALILLTGAGMTCVLALHGAAARMGKKQERHEGRLLPEGFVEICDVSEISENRAKTVLIDGENIAVFKYNGKLSAVSNLCRHQNGPLGEGKIVDGCITCPWHGYQYLPHNGQAPPPFTEKLETYDVMLSGSTVCVNPKPYPAGTDRPPCRIEPITH